MKNPMQYFREGFETRKSNMIDSASNLAEYQDKLDCLFLAGMTIYYIYY